MMNTKRLQEILSVFPNIRAAVVGDFFLDRYWNVAPELDEPSVETGLTAYQIVDRWGSPGAAGTVTNNLSALGVGKIDAIGFIGKDGEGVDLAGYLDNIGVARTYMLETPLRVTPCYTKPMQNGVEMNRFDIKNRTVTPSVVEEAIISSIRSIADEVDAFIIMDQVSEPNCGVLTDNVRQCLIQLGRTRPKLLLYADSRERIGLYDNMLIKCNEREALEVFGLYDGSAPPFETVKQCGVKLAERTGHTVFITMGERGQLVNTPSGNSVKVTHVPAIRVEGDIDICGAGDATSSALVSSLCSGATHEEAAMIGNLASSVTIRKIGQTGTATPEEILRAYKQLKINNSRER
ncbi:MAG: PfkB family carbohydrate kinase [Planctomycetaceae bacterium]|jgi:rfaE bifunctional protein kinase chain/domain|nr:PfkB family carbohydrate kinase [Planctomycetaceae bacterium]